MCSSDLEIAEGIDFIKSLVDGHVIMPLPTYYGANGDGATHQSNEWITGKIAGIFEWDSAASKYQDALDEENKPGFTVGEEIKFGDYNGGFSKVSMGLAITKTCEHPAEAATLINFLLNETAGAEIMGSSYFNWYAISRGIYSGGVLLDASQSSNVRTGIPVCCENSFLDRKSVV